MKNRIFQAVIGMGVLLFLVGCSTRMESPYVQGYHEHGSCYTASSCNSTCPTPKASSCNSTCPTPKASSCNSTCPTPKVEKKVEHIQIKLVQKPQYIQKPVKVYKNKSCAPRCCYAYGVDGRCIAW